MKRQGCFQGLDMLLPRILLEMRC